METNAPTEVKYNDDALRGFLEWVWYWSGFHADGDTASYAMQIEGLFKNGEKERVGEIIYRALKAQVQKELSQMEDPTKRVLVKCSTILSLDPDRLPPEGTNEYKYVIAENLVDLLKNVMDLSPSEIAYSFIDSIEEVEI